MRETKAEMQARLERKLAAKEEELKQMGRELSTQNAKVTALEKLLNAESPDAPVNFRDIDATLRHAALTVSEMYGSKRYFFGSTVILQILAGLREEFYQIATASR